MHVGMFPLQLPEDRQVRLLSPNLYPRSHEYTDSVPAVVRLNSTEPFVGDGGRPQSTMTAIGKQVLHHSSAADMAEKHVGFISSSHKLNTLTR